MMTNNGGCAIDCPDMGLSERDKTGVKCRRSKLIEEYQGSMQRFEGCQSLIYDVQYKIQRN
jgi:hypothetical protein